MPFLKGTLSVACKRLEAGVIADVCGELLAILTSLYFLTFKQNAVKAEAELWVFCMGMYQIVKYQSVQLRIESM